VQVLFGEAEHLAHGVHEHLERGRREPILRKRREHVARQDITLAHRQAGPDIGHQLAQLDAVERLVPQGQRQAFHRISFRAQARPHTGLRFARRLDRLPVRGGQSMLGHGAPLSALRQAPLQGPIGDITRRRVMAEDFTGGVDRADVARQADGAPAAHGEPGIAQRRDQAVDIFFDPVDERPIRGLQPLACAVDQSGQIGPGGGRLAAVGDDLRSGLRLEVFEGGDLDHPGEAVGERRIQGQGSVVDLPFRFLPVQRDRRVHRRPAIAQPLERQSLHPSFVNDGEQFVLMLRAATGNLVQKHRLGVPQVRGRAQVLEAVPPGIGNRVTQQIVKADQAGIVVAVRKRQGLSEAVEQLGFCGAVGADEQQGTPVRERRQNQRIEVIQSEDMESAQQGVPLHGRGCGHVRSPSPGQRDAGRRSGEEDATNALAAFVNRPQVVA
jgi:hypothetical protein